jgi:hypothetical protein
MEQDDKTTTALDRARQEIFDHIYEKRLLLESPVEFVRFQDSVCIDETDDTLEPFPSLGPRYLSFLFVSLDGDLYDRIMGVIKENFGSGSTA